MADPDKSSRARETMYFENRLPIDRPSVDLTGHADGSRRRILGFHDPQGFSVVSGFDDRPNGGSLLKPHDEFILLAFHNDLLGFGVWCYRERIFRLRFIIRIENDFFSVCGKSGDPRGVFLRFSRLSAIPDQLTSFRQ